MLGTVENPGVMFLTMMELYKRINEVKEEKTCDVAVSYCEVSHGYNQYCQLGLITIIDRIYWCIAHFLEPEKLNQSCM